jgi:putative flavoprotein involved in K+ transport
MTTPHDVLVIGSGQAGLAAGLVFVGLSNQWTYASATLRGVGPDAAYVIGQLRHYLRGIEEAQVGRRDRARRLFGIWRCCSGKEGMI